MIKNNITKFFKKKNRQHGTGIAVYISNPKHAWKTIIYVFVVLNIGIIFFNGYLFLEISDGDIFKIEQDVIIKIDTIDRTLLRETLEVFDGMEMELEELKKNRPSIIDPSL